MVLNSFDIFFELFVRFLVVNCSPIPKNQSSQSHFIEIKCRLKFSFWSHLFLNRGKSIIYIYCIWILSSHAQSVKSKLQYFLVFRRKVFYIVTCEFRFRTGLKWKIWYFCILWGFTNFQIQYFWKITIII